MTQTWHNLLFAHWPVSPDILRPLVPQNIGLDLYDGQAWLGVITFRLSGIRLRGFPEVPLVARLSEINVRTYVTVDNKPGVYFLSLDANNPIAMALARRWFRLPYKCSEIDFAASEDGIHFNSQRLEGGSSQAGFSATYSPSSDVFTSAPGTLEHWLTERYCYYVAGRRQSIYRCDVYHASWPLQCAQADIAKNSMALSIGVQLPIIESVLHYSLGVSAHIWPIRKLTDKRVSAQVSEFERSYV